MRYQSLSFESTFSEWEPYKREKTLEEMLVRYYIFWLMAA